jgi:thymidylate synthase ThyX
MQSQRVTDLSAVKVVNTCPAHHAEEFDAMAEAAIGTYQHLVNIGVRREDARGLLPMNTECNLVAKYNLRSLVEVVRARSSLRTQAEYATIAEQYYLLTIAAWPWSAPFFESKNAKALEMLREVVEELGLETGSGLGWKVAKAMDLFR